VYPCFEDYSTKLTLQILHGPIDIATGVKMQQGIACHMSNNKVKYILILEKVEWICGFLEK
jgi:hypothetical protein